MPIVKTLRVPETLAQCIALLETHMQYLEEDSRRGEVVRECAARITEFSEERIDKAKIENPLAFIKVSYVQSLKLNAWIWGINFLCDFDANRMGKTACAVFNGLLWFLPNDPEWKIFQPYTDDFGNRVHVLTRPDFIRFLLLQDFLDEHEEMRGDPLKGLDDPDNAEKFANLQKLLPKCFVPCFPSPSFSAKQNVIWLGAPDADYHKNIIFPEWRKWLPKNMIKRDSDHDKVFSLQVPWQTQFGGKRISKWEIIGKSYQSEDTKWSGAAVRGVILTEGLKRETLNEIRQRFQSEAFASWDYTPYEARNTGSRSALAHKVFQRKEELPLRYCVFSGFGIDKCPDFILPTKKRNDLIRMWKDRPEGQARIYGKFFSDSPQALSNLDREFHTLTWTKAELFKRIPNGLLFRSIDPGYDHPTSCVWGLLSPDNTWYIYRMWSEAGLSIGDRCRKIVELSGNKLFQYRYGRNQDDFLWKEDNSAPDAEKFVTSIADFHLFKGDEITDQPYVKNYIREGLLLRPSITMRPRDRALEVNRLLERSNFRLHPETKSTPGSRIFFLINEFGVANGLERLENLFWARYLVGENQGMPKDELASHGDDEFDALGYLVLSPFRWSANIRPRIIYPNDTSTFTELLKLAA